MSHLLLRSTLCGCELMDDNGWVAVAVEACGLLQVCVFLCSEVWVLTQKLNLYFFSY